MKQARMTAFSHAITLFGTRFPALQLLSRRRKDFEKIYPFSLSVSHIASFSPALLSSCPFPIVCLDLALGLTVCRQSSVARPHRVDITKLSTELYLSRDW